MKNNIALFVLVILGLLQVHAQQDPQYTQYMYNQAILNPAYAGSTEGLSMVALYRNQWSGLDDAPKTITFSGHSPVGKNVGLGLSIISDQIGPVKEHNLYADFSYTLQLGETSKLAFGVKAGATVHNRDLKSGTIVLDADDPLFSEDSNSVTPNVGLGTFLHNDKYYVGISVPNMLSSAHLDVNGVKYGSEVQHYFLTGGYVFQLSPNTKFKPSTMLKSSFSAPLSFDINTNFLLYDKFEIGASYRHEDAVSGLVGFAFTPKIRIGYAYDHVLSDINNAAKSSHEFFLQFDLNFPKKEFTSPRFF